MSSKKQEKGKRPRMSDFGLVSFMGNAPEWTEQGKKQAAYVAALAAYEAAEEAGGERK